MFLKYIDFIFVPFRTLHARYIGVRTTKGNIQAEFRRLKALGQRGQNAVGEAQAKIVGAQQQVPQGGQAMQPQMPQGQMPGQVPPMAGQQPGAGPPGAINPGPPIRTTGFWIFKKKFCTQCNTQLDNSWDRCPYCAQIAVQAAAPKPAGPMKTQAFMMDSNGVPGQTQLIGWVVPLSGAQRGQLFTLSPTSSIGNDPACTVVLHDRFMSGKHAEIKAENGIWVLKDLGSTNGTYVNNRRVERHELVDNDFIKFGGAMVKFKSL
jgi:FHA domain